MEILIKNFDSKNLLSEMMMEKYKIFFSVNDINTKKKI